MQARVTDAAIQIYGGMGVTEETAVGHYFKRLSILESQFGSTDFHLRRYTDLSADEMPTAMAAE